MLSYLGGSGINAYTSLRPNANALIGRAIESFIQNQQADLARQQQERQFQQQRKDQKKAQKKASRGIFGLGPIGDILITEGISIGVNAIAGANPITGASPDAGTQAPPDYSGLGQGGLVSANRPASIGPGSLPSGGGGGLSGFVQPNTPASLRGPASFEPAGNFGYTPKAPVQSSQYPFGATRGDSIKNAVLAGLVSRLGSPAVGSAYLGRSDINPLNAARLGLIGAQIGAINQQARGRSAEADRTLTLTPFEQQKLQNESLRESAHASLYGAQKNTEDALRLPKVIGEYAGAARDIAATRFDLSRAAGQSLTNSYIGPQTDAEIARTRAQTGLYGSRQETEDVLRFPLMLGAYAGAAEKARGAMGLNGESRSSSAFERLSSTLPPEQRAKLVEGYLKRQAGLAGPPETMSPGEITELTELINQDIADANNIPDEAERRRRIGTLEEELNKLGRLRYQSISGQLGR